MKDKGELTTKALMLLKTYLECGCNKSKTAKRLGKSYQEVYSQINKPYVRRIFQMLLIEKKITFERLAKVLDEGLDAMKVISATVIVNNNVPGSLEQDTPVVAEKLANGRTVDFIDIPDHLTRHKYLNTALECFDILKYNTKAENTSRNFTNIVIVDKRDEPIIPNIARDIKEDDDSEDIMPEQDCQEQKEG